MCSGEGDGISSPAGLPHSGIDGAKPACGPPSLFAACRALHRPMSPRHPPHTGYRLSENASRPRTCPAAANASLDASPLHQHIIILRSAPPGQNRGAKARIPRPRGQGTQTITHLHLLMSRASNPLPLQQRAVSCWRWVFLDSNQRPLPYQGSALTT